MGRNKKGESLVAVACAGVEEHHASGRARSFCATDTLADSLDAVPRILDSFSLPSQMAALGTSFLMQRLATPEEVAVIRDVLLRGKE